MEETRLICEDTLEGVLTAVYRAYEWKLDPSSTVVQIGEDDLRLFTVYREVETDAVRARKVANTVKKRFGAEAWEDISHALAAEATDKGQAVYQTIATGLSGRIRGRLMGGLGNESIRRTFELSRHVHNEAGRMREFLRFRELEGNVLFAGISPNANVTELIMPHFADRFPLENFMILDERRGLAGIHAAGADWFLLRLTEGMQAQLASMEKPYSAKELEMATLFRHFCQATGIEERKNSALQQQLLPLKYRSFMTEFDHDETRTQEGRKGKGSGDQNIRAWSGGIHFTEREY